MPKMNKRIKPVEKPRNFFKLSGFAVLLKAFRYIKIFVAVIACGTALFFSGDYLTKVVNQFLNRPISEVVINGHFEYVDKTVIVQTVNTALDGNFISENIHGVQATLQSFAWIDSVTVSRAWPDKVTITVNEHTPIARWGDVGFVNIRGELIYTDSIDKLEKFPSLHGEDSDVNLVMENYSFLAKLFQRYGFHVNYLQKDSRGSWGFTFNNGWQVVLGRDDIIYKANRLVFLLEKGVLTKDSEIVTVDARYPNGVAVEWHKSNDDLSKEQVSNNYQQQMLSHSNNMAFIRG